MICFQQTLCCLLAFTRIITLFSFQGAGFQPFTRSDRNTPLLSKMLRFDLGGDKRNRTADPLLARQVLSQLSYTPIVVANSASLIPAFAKTRSLHCSSSSNRTRFAGLRFEFGDTFLRWWAQVDSNHRPHDYQSCALAS